MPQYDSTAYPLVGGVLPPDRILFWQDGEARCARVTVADLAKSFTSGSYVTNIAALKALTVSGASTGLSVLVGGYYAVSDKGGGYFYYDSTSTVPDNGGTVIAPNIGVGRWIRLYSGPVNILWFGAIPDGVTDNAAAIQAAIDSVCPLVGSPNSKAGAVYAPAGDYLVQTTLNLTNSRTVGTLRRDGLHFYGDGETTVILGKTGAGSAIMEVTGTQFLRVEGMMLTTSGVASGKSTLGVFSGLSVVLTQTQNQVFRDFYIDLHDDPSANSSLGTIAFWNFGSEENTYGPLWFQANICFVLTSDNSGFQPGGFTYTSYQAPLVPSHSMTMTTFSGECFLTTKNNRNPSVYIQNITGLDAQHMFIANIGSGGSNNTAIYFIGNATGLKWHGNIEGLASIDFDGGIINSEMNISFGTVTATAQGALRVKQDGISPSSIINSKISVAMEATYARPILTTKNGDETTATLFSIVSTEIYGRDAGGGSGTPGLYIPLNVRKNAASVNNKLNGVNTSNQTQPAFGAGLSADHANVTGDGTNVLLSSFAWTEEFDVGSGFNAANGTFTAPVTGNYVFNARIELTTIDASHDNGSLQLLITSISGTQPYYLDLINPGAVQTTNNVVMMGGSATAFMSAGDTATLRLQVTSGPKTVTAMSGLTGTFWRTRFEGSLIGA